MAHTVRSLFVVSVAALVSGCGLGAPTYPKFGAASYRMEGAATPSDGATSVSTTIYRNRANMRMETRLPTGAASIVYDDRTGAAYIVTPTSASTPTVTPTVIPAPNPSAAPAQAAGAPLTPAAPVVVSATGGTAVRIADENAPKPIEDGWVSLGARNARQVGACSVAGETGSKWTPRESSKGVSRVACITDDGIVLEILEGDRTLWRATRVERGVQDASLFGVPAGYQVIDPQAVAQTVSETMQDLGKVAGDPATPLATTAPASAPAPAPKT